MDEDPMYDPKTGVRVFRNVHHANEFAQDCDYIMSPQDSELWYVIPPSKVN